MQVLVIAVLGIGVASASGAEPATTRASVTQSAASTQPSPQKLLRQVADLGNADADVRADARRELLGMSREQLLALPKLLSHQPPLNASQRALLHEIVVHVYLATGSYPSDRSQGFLGVTIAEVHIPATDAAAPMENVDSPIDPDDASPDTGIIILERMPGFCGYRAFESGDVILAAREGEIHPIHSVKRLQDLVLAHHAGDEVQFQVLRRGKKIDVKVRLDGMPAVVAPAGAPGAGPAMVAPGTIQAFINERSKAAQDFWDRHFASVAGPHVS
jgi:hypothetical protein